MRTRDAWRGRAPFSALCVLGWLAGCAPSGDDALNVLRAYEPPGREYRLRYLEPPWELVSTDGTTARLRIRSSAMIFGGPEAGPPKFDLVVTVEPGDAGARASADASAFAAAGVRVIAGPREVEASGTEGIEVLGQSTVVERHFRHVYLPLSGGRVVRLAFEATPALDTREVDAMIATTSVGSEGP